MEKEFVTYQQALRLKALGFDEECFKYQYKSENPSKESILKNLTDEDYIGIPLKSQAFRWFRENYGLHPHIFSREDSAFVWCVRWYVDGLQKDVPYESSNTYEEAESACLDKLIEIVESNLN